MAAMLERDEASLAYAAASEAVIADKTSRH